MSANDTQRTIALFDSFAWADEAAKFLRLWDQSLSEVKFGTVSLVCAGDGGQLKVRNHGARNILEGVEAGLIVGLLAGRLTVLGSLRGMLAGALLGALAGTLSFRTPDLTPEELEGLKLDLTGEKAALIIEVQQGTAEQVAGEIAKLNGTVKRYPTRAESASSLSMQPVASASGVA